MSYSVISIFALILNLIISHEAFRNIRIRSDEQKKERKAAVRFSYFIISADCYFVADIAWGLLYENHHIDALYPILYTDCILYFFFMFLTMLTWMRYIVAYLDKRGRRSKMLLYGVWSMFTLGLVYLIINYFYPFIFSFNEAHEYVTESGRHIAFILQILLYMVTSTYMLHISRKSIGGERNRYIEVGLTCLVMELFLIIQILDPKYPSYAMGLMIGICVIHTFVEAGELKEKEIVDHIALGLAGDYEAMYYIDIESGAFREFSTSQEYASMNVPVAGKDFYAETMSNIDRYVHPDDREFARSLYSKETMLNNLEGRNSYSYKYRIMVGGFPRYFRFTLMRAHDDRHFVLCEKDIDDEVVAENIRLENQKKHVTFSRIAESLATNYDVIYYVDAQDSSFVSYECNNIYGKLNMQESGNDFFDVAQIDIRNVVHKNDQDVALEFINRDHFASAFKRHKSCSIDYRIMQGRKVHYVRMTARMTTDGTHYIIGIENIDDEIKKEKQHLKALNTEKELARRDELTGVRNKTAYKELEKSVQENIDNGMDYLPFALVVCDANNLKKINDSEGHVAGDEYIKESAKLLCEIFDHSPVFRVGGDEFVVFLRGSDYSNREELMLGLHSQVLENMQSGSGPILASGIAEYNPETDSFVSEIFDRADREMYDNKQMLKKEAPSYRG
ncbi:MAG: GGDEF domain-containing protein [Lachnospiraceae bacterium]|nr:GGDEF domain-containing protein [Lachnospiraceae bacterium]